MYSRPRSAMQLCFILCNASGDQKSKMTAYKQEYLYLSLYAQRSFMISKAIFMFSRSRNSMKLFFILDDASGSQKFKMAAHKQEYLYLSLYTTQLYDFKGYIYVFKVQEFNNSMKLFFILCDASGSQKSKMAAYKKETHFSACIQHICKILTVKQIYSRHMS